MTDTELQSAYWGKQRKRRHPSDPIIAAFAKPKLQFMLTHTVLPSSPSILDVGCGNGYFTYYLQEIGPTIGLDYTTGMLHMNPCRRLVQTSAHAMPFRDRSFDVVFCSNLLHHVGEPLAVVLEMKRVSQRYVVIHEPNRNNPAILALGLFKAEERASLLFSAAYVKAMVQNVGLKIVACQTMGFVTPNRMPRPVAMLAGKVNIPNPLGAYTVVVAERLY